MKRFKGINGTQIKIIAIISMFIDHFAAIILGNYLENTVPGYNKLYIINYSLYSDVMNNEDFTSFIFITSIICRLIGRLAFPLFVFLLIEGFKYTSNIKKYIIRLFIFALISQLPFNLLVSNALLSFNRSNVFFTLLFGLVAITLIDKYAKEQIWFINIGLTGLITIIFCALAFILETDYNAIGVLAIITMYLLKDKKTFGYILSSLILIISNIVELPVLIGLPIIQMYNGNKGKGLKYFFYIFYPAHIIILYIVAIKLNIVSFRLF